VLQVVHGATPQVIAEKLDRSPAEIVKILFMAGRDGHRDERRSPTTRSA
jgi:hypothetical protein